MSLTAELDALKIQARTGSSARTVEVLTQSISDMSRSGIEERSLKPGDRVPDFRLSSAGGQTVHLADLLARGPVVLSFFRGGWCPFCSLELDCLQRALPAINDLGATLVAVSPETGESTSNTVEQHSLTFEVLSDPGNALARQFGIVYHLQDEMQAIYKEFDLDLPTHNGDDSFDLPVPATYVFDTGGVIQVAFVDPDYTRRLDPVEILGTLRNLKDQP